MSPVQLHNDNNNARRIDCQHAFLPSIKCFSHYPHIHISHRILETSNLKKKRTTGNADLLVREYGSKLGSFRGHTIWHDLSILRPSLVKLNLDHPFVGLQFGASHINNWSNCQLLQLGDLWRNPMDFKAVFRCARCYADCPAGEEVLLWAEEEELPGSANMVKGKFLQTNLIVEFQFSRKS